MEDTFQFWRPEHEAVGGEVYCGLQRESQSHMGGGWGGQALDLVRRADLVDYQT